MLSRKLKKSIKLFVSCIVVATADLNTVACFADSSAQYDRNYQLTSAYTDNTDVSSYGTKSNSVSTKKQTVAKESDSALSKTKNNVFKVVKWVLCAPVEFTTGAISCFFKIVVLIFAATMSAKNFCKEKLEQPYVLPTDNDGIDRLKKFINENGTNVDETATRLTGEKKENVLQNYFEKLQNK